MIIYKTTNTVNNKFYVGMDRYNNPDYLGSGIQLQRAINKYGKENFIKVILQECETDEELCAAEIYWIKKLDATNRDIAYNIAIGGKGGPIYKGKGKNHSMYGKGDLLVGEKNGMFGRKHSKETIDKIRCNPNVVRFGKANGNFGKGLFGKDNPNSTPIKAIDITTGKVLDEFESRSQTITDTAITPWMLDRVLDGTKLSHNGVKYVHIKI